jgi:hypothetical protein
MISFELKSFCSLDGRLIFELPSFPVRHVFFEGMKLFAVIKDGNEKNHSEKPHTPPV